MAGLKKNMKPALMAAAGGAAAALASGPIGDMLGENQEFKPAIFGAVGFLLMRNPKMRDLGAGMLGAAGYEAAQTFGIAGDGSGMEGIFAPKMAKRVNKRLVSERAQIMQRYVNKTARNPTPDKVRFINRDAAQNYGLRNPNAERGSSRIDAFDRRPQFNQSAMLSAMALNDGGVC